jgi:hypothetical protein
MFIEDVTLIIVVACVYVYFWQIYAKMILEFKLPALVKRLVLNMHHGTQEQVCLDREMQTIFDADAHERVFRDTIVPYARRLWLEQKDTRELNIDFENYVISV